MRQGFTLALLASAALMFSFSGAVAQEISGNFAGGSVRIGNDTAGCDAGRAGAVRYSGGTLSLCDGTNWTAFAGSGSSQWTASGANIYYDAGNVGVGTASPLAMLHVNGRAALSGVEGDLFFKSASATVMGRWLLENASTNRMLLQRITGTIDSAVWGASVMNVDLDAPNNTFVIDGLGNVGIGTAAPSAKLTVAGTGTLVQIGNAQVGVDTRDSSYVQLRADDNGPAEGASAGDFLRIRANRAGGVNHLQVVDETQVLLSVGDGGNVGIGTASPAETLDVNGHIAIGGTRIQTAQHGSFSGAVPSGCFQSSECDVSWSVTFPKAFASIPQVLLNTGSCGGNGRGLGATFYTNKSKTAFTVSYVYKLNGDWSGNCVINWIAVGEM